MFVNMLVDCIKCCWGNGGGNEGGGGFLVGWLGEFFRLSRCLLGRIFLVKGIRLGG